MSLQLHLLTEFMEYKKFAKNVVSKISRISNSGSLKGLAGDNRVHVNYGLTGDLYQTKRGTYKIQAFEERNRWLVRVLTRKEVNCREIVS